jgi:hypothetical protein
MTKINTNNKIKRRSIIEGGSNILARKKEMAAKQIDTWRERNTKALKDWKGIKIIRFFRDKI